MKHLFMILSLLFVVVALTLAIATKNEHLEILFLWLAIGAKAIQELIELLGE